MTDGNARWTFEWTLNRKLGFAFLCAGLLQWLLGLLFSDPWWMIKYDLNALFPLVCILSCIAFFAGFLHLFEGFRPVSNVMLSLLFTLFLLLAHLVGGVALTIMLAPCR